jgi:N-acetylglucosamine-6-phosphate deacetylase
MRLSGNLFTNDQWVNGDLEIEQGIITAIIVKQDAIVAGDDFFIPGFIDLHVHGGGGRDIMEGGDAAKVLSETHVQFGTTSFLATTMTAKEADIIQAFEGVAAAMKNPPAGADILGIHLEGPLLNGHKLGAQPNYPVLASQALVNRFLAIAPIRVVTLAPEFEANMALIPWLVEHGIRVQLGHTLANYGQCLCAMKAGAQSFTHLYNAMSGLNHRDSGAVGAALAHSTYAEIIPDLVHTDHGAIRTAMRAIPKLYGVTDGTAACGMPDGQYKLGENDVFKQGNSVRLKDGTLAGSALTLDQALKNFISLGDDLGLASKRLSQFQADYLGLTDRGRLAVGLRADINQLNAHHTIVQTWVAGQAFK